MIKLTKNLTWYSQIMKHDTHVMFYCLETQIWLGSYQVSYSCGCYAYKIVWNLLQHKQKKTQNLIFEIKSPGNKNTN